MKPKSYSDIMSSLIKALEATPPASLTSGSALQVECISTVLSNVTFDMKNIIMWPTFMKYPPEYQGLLVLLRKLEVKIP